MKRKLFILQILLVIIFVGCKTQNKVTYSKGKNVISITAKNQRLSEVLNNIEKNSGFKIFVENFDDKNVNLRIRNASVNDAIIQMIGSDSKYYLDYTLPGEALIKGNSGDKVGRKAVDKPQIVKPDPKESDIASINTKGDNMKLPSEKLLQNNEYIKQEKGKVDPKVSIERSNNIKPIKTKKNPIAQPDGEMVQLRFYISEKEIRIEKINQLPGTPDSTFRETLNDYIIAFAISSKLVYLTSFGDPFILHSYSKDPKESHKTIQSKTGYFSIIVPSSVVNRKTINNTIVTIYKYRGGLPTNELSPNIFVKNDRMFEKINSLYLEKYSTLLNY